MQENTPDATFQRAYSPRKVVIIGAGNVGSHVAMNLMFDQFADEIVFLDINEQAAQAQVTDLRDMLTALKRHVRIRVGDYSDCRDAHFVIMTAGRSRKPGETRLQMLDSTFAILDGIVRPLKESGFNGILICVSNPADVVTEYFYRKLDLPRNQVFGTGTALDSVRLRRMIASIVDIDRDQVQAICMGEHGDSSFIPESHVAISGIPMDEYLRIRPELGGKFDYEAIEKDVHEAGSKIVAGKHSTEFGIGAVVSMIVSAILHHERLVTPLSYHLEGEYGESDVSCGVPCVLGRDGVLEVLQIELTDDERKKQHTSCGVIRDSLAKVKTSEQN